MGMVIRNNLDSVRAYNIYNKNAMALGFGDLRKNARAYQLEQPGQQKRAGQHQHDQNRRRRTQQYRRPAQHGKRTRRQRG